MNLRRFLSYKQENYRLAKWMTSGTRYLGMYTHIESFNLSIQHKRKLQTIEREYEELKTKHNEDLLKMQASFKKERDLIEDMFSKGEVRKQELQDLVQGSPHSQAPNFLSAVPECYSCLEKYR